MSKLAPPFPRLQIAQLEGRGQFTRYKQDQLSQLFDTLTRSASALKLAIQADSGHTPTEVDLEFTLALSELKTHYQSLDLAKDLEGQRRISAGRDNLERTKPIGIVYIVPTKWCLFYSIISPLGAALVAGNCVILELPQTLSQVSALLKKSLTDSLDADMFAISSSRPAAIDFTRQCTLVLQQEEEFDHSQWLQVLQSPSSSGSAVVIGRTADIAQAANAIANAGLSFRGRSPYSPHLVLVNEFVADRFLSALIAHIIDPSPATGKKETKVNGHVGIEKGGLKTIKDSSQHGGTDTAVSGSNGKVIEVSDRDSPLLLENSDGSTIVVHRISSLDDAIDSFSGSKPLAACFTFGGLDEANYTSTYINAYLSTINHIPLEFLIGPVAPVHPSSRATASPRYSPSLFTVPRPQYLHSESRLNLTLLNQKQNMAELKKWSAEVLKPLPEIKRPSGFLLNFFGTGIVIGFSTVLLTITGGSATVCWFLYTTYRRHY